MTIWCPRLPDRPGPAYRRLAEAIGDAIAAGRLTDGERLPPQRNLAFRLGLSLNTVSRAYAEAIGRGFVRGEVGRGTFVRAAGPLPAVAPVAGLDRPDGGVIDFSLNLPAPGAGAEALAATLAAIGGSGDLARHLDHRPGDRVDGHAAAAAAWLGRLGLDTDPDEMVVTAGAQHGLTVALLALTLPGDAVLVEALTYAPAKALARHLGLKLVPVAMDVAGLSPAALDAACRATAARTLYCLPTLHTPTTVTMPTDRRAEIAAIARTHDLTIVEDDVFGFLPPTRPPPLAQVAPERTVFVSSVSKCLAPGLRVGYLRIPAKHRAAVRAAVHLTCWMPPPLMAEIATRWITDGTAERLNAHQRAEAETRQAIAARLLPADAISADPHGFHLWLQLPPPWRADAFRAAAERRGVRVVTAETFAVDPPQAPQSVRLCLTHETARERVEAGLSVIAGLLEDPAESGELVV